MNQLTNPASAWPHSSQALAAHREWIGGRVLTLLSQYWRDDDPTELTAAIAGDWAEILKGLSQKSINSACVQYLRDEPRKKPTPGEIYKRAVKLEPRTDAKPGDVNDFDADKERQCLIRKECGEDYATWPRDQLEYLVKARGGHDVAEFISRRSGWYRPGGPRDQMKGGAA